MIRIVFTVLLAIILLASTKSWSAEITLRDGLKTRLAKFETIYGEGSFILNDYKPEETYWKNVRVIGLTGVIEDGDTDQLAQLIGPEDNVGPFIVVMNSAGGSFLEGIRLGEFLRLFRGGNGEPALHGVVVLSGEECMSACAVAFALSAYPRDSGNSVRFVELSARLGFHMPFVPSQQKSRQAEISQAMDLTYEIMAEYMQMIGNGIAPPALVQNALHYRRPSAFFLLKGGAMTRFMDFVAVAGPKGGMPISLAGLTVRDALNMCQILTYSSGRMMTPDEYEFWPVDIYSEGDEETEPRRFYRRLICLS